MQKEGVVDREDACSQAEPIQGELRKAGLRTRIKDFLGRHGTVEAQELLEKDGIKESIQKVFSYSQAVESGRISNSLFGTVDLAFSYFMVSSHTTALFGALGIIASETISAVKNHRDTHPPPPELSREEKNAATFARVRHAQKSNDEEPKSYQELRSRELEKLRGWERQILAELRFELSRADKDEKKAIKNLIKETEKFFSDIDKKSKAHLNNVLRNRVEGFGISLVVAGLNTAVPPFSWFANAFSNYTVDLVRGWGLQFPPFNADLFLISIAAKAAWLAVTASIPTLVACELHNRSDWTGQRVEDMHGLYARLDGIFEKIGK